MSVGRLIPTEAEELLSVLRRSALQTPTRSQTDSAVHFVGDDEPVLSRSGEPINIAHQTLMAEATAFGSLPPSPPTLRARVAMPLVRLINRLLWWQTAVSKRFAIAVSEYAESQQQQQTKQRQVVADIEERLRGVEHTIQDLHRTNAESRVIARFEARFASLEEALQARHSQFQQEIEVERRRITALEQVGQFTSHRVSGVESAAQFNHHRLLNTEQGIQAVSAEAQKLWAGLAAEMNAREATDRRVTLVASTAREGLHADAAGYPQLDDQLYMALEERFRGSREQIRERQRIYLPILQEKSIGTDNMPVLDLGCGRGEWLETLKTEGLRGMGVDSNRDMLNMCLSQGLEVVQTDSISYLSGLSNASIGAITSFHMIEHLPFGLLINLLDNALRVLKPGGLLILETPNPRNILVSTHTFYLDPTHIKPIPSELLWFLMEMRGFRNLRRLELHPPDGRPEPRENTEMLNRFWAPLDYSIIGERP